MGLIKGRTIAILGTFFTLSGCAEMALSPVEEVQQAQRLNSSQTINSAKRDAPTAAKVSVIKKQSVQRFVCDNEQEVQVRSMQMKNSKGIKPKTISVTYAGRTHTLSPAVTKNGKKYSNIRWVWWEPNNGKAELSDNQKKILAKGCVKQP